MSEKDNVISKETIQRLIKDITQLKDDELEGIYYRHDEDDILSGKALIIGPPGTPYAGGYYLFTFRFPFDYPHSPPIVKFYTNDGLTRMHPNLYKNGKVCLSILNTWSGDSWTGCQTIASVLLTIQSILTNNPLLNEPGISKFHPDFYKYSEIVRYKNIILSMLKVVQNKDNEFYNFDDLIMIARKDFITNYSIKCKILGDAIKKCNSYKIKNKIKDTEFLLFTNLYGIRCKINYDNAEELMPLIYEKILILDII